MSFPEARDRLLAKVKEDNSVLQNTEKRIRDVKKMIENYEKQIREMSSENDVYNKRLYILNYIIGKQDQRTR